MLTGNDWADKVISDMDKNLWLRFTSKPIWSTFTFDPYNFMGRHVMLDRDNWRTKAIITIRIGSNVDEFVTVKPFARS